MLDSYHMTKSLLRNLNSAVHMLYFFYYVRNGVMDVVTFLESYKLQVVYLFYCIGLFHSQTLSHVID